jgi:hypothetical protein
VSPLGVDLQQREATRRRSDMVNTTNLADPLLQWPDQHNI